jgi:hypothetical protein
VVIAAVAPGTKTATTPAPAETPETTRNDGGDVAGDVDDVAASVGLEAQLGAGGGHVRSATAVP